jgi:hypothetical protein
MCFWPLLSQLLQTPLRKKQIWTVQAVCYNKIKLYKHSLSSCNIEINNKIMTVDLMKLVIGVSWAQLN